MLRKLIRILLDLIIVILLFLPSIPVIADSPAMFENYTAGGDGDSAPIYGANLSAQQFTTGATAHTVTTFTLMLKKFGSPGTVMASIRDASGGLVTGINLAYVEMNGNYFSTTYSYQTFVLTTPIDLVASTQYSIVVNAIYGDVSNYILWQKDAGGGLSDAVGNQSSDGGVTWSSTTPEDYLFQIWGKALNVIPQPDSKAAITQISINRSLYEDNDTLVYGMYNLPYKTIPDTNADLNFKFYLMDSGATTTYGMANFFIYHDRGYNHGLISWYFPASALTWRDTYIIRIQEITGRFNTPVNTDVTIPDSAYTTETTQLANQLELAGNIYTIGQALQTEYDTHFFDTTNTNYILSSVGQDYFQGAIIGLQAMCPQIFLFQQVELDYSTKQYTTVQFDSYADRFTGTWVGDSMTAGGAMIGMNGNMFMMFVVTLPLCIGAIIFTSKKWGHTEPGLMFSSLVMIMAVIMGWMPPALFATVFQLFGIYIGYLLFFSKSSGELDSKLLSFTVYCYFISVLICIIMQGTYYGKDERDIFNGVSFFTTYNLPIIHHIPVFNTDFIKSFGQILTWDYSFYSGSYVILRWFWFSILSVGPAWGLVKLFINLIPSIIGIFRPNITL